MVSLYVLRGKFWSPGSPCPSPVQTSFFFKTFVSSLEYLFFQMNFRISLLSFIWKIHFGFWLEYIQFIDKFGEIILPIMPLIVSRSFSEIAECFFIWETVNWQRGDNTSLLFLGRSRVILVLMPTNSLRKVYSFQLLKTKCAIESRWRNDGGKLEFCTLEFIFASNKISGPLSKVAYFQWPQWWGRPQS